jgi:hypothetical protein
MRCSLVSRPARDTTRLADRIHGWRGRDPAPALARVMGQGPRDSKVFLSPVGSYCVRHSEMISRSCNTPTHHGNDVRWPLRRPLCPNSVRFHHTHHERTVAAAGFGSGAATSALVPVRPTLSYVSPSILFPTRPRRRSRLFHPSRCRPSSSSPPPSTALIHHLFSR